MNFRNLIFLVAFILFTIQANGSNVQLQKDQDGHKLLVDGKAFMIKGMNWDYYPIGTNYTYSLWDQSEQTIISVLDKEMSLIQKMGINALRIYTGIPKKWIAYIYDNFGLYTMLNHPFGRYGFYLNEEWVPYTDYGNPKAKEYLLNEVLEMVAEYRNTPGLLLYLLGNENNYGLYRKEPNAINQSYKKPDELFENRGMYKLFLLGKKNKPAKKYSADKVYSDQEVHQMAVKMYSLFNEAAAAIKMEDKSHPVALCNGDLMFIDIIREHCSDIDIFGTNMYRGISFGDSFQRVAEELEKPILFTEFGADAYNAIEGKEDQKSQAYYLIRNWKEIYANSAGIGGAKNSIGGFTYQFSDGWWKVYQTKNLDVHDSIATWNNGGYHRDNDNGANNMNEEWFGICSKVPTDSNGNYELSPRAAFFILRQTNAFSPYTHNASLVQLEGHFSKIQLDKAIQDSNHYRDSLQK